MANEYTELLITVLRGGDVPVRMQGRALVDLADQRDALATAAATAVGQLNKLTADFAEDIITGWGDEGMEELDGTIELLRAALQKARTRDGN